MSGDARMKCHRCGKPIIQHYQCKECLCDPEAENCPNKTSGDLLSRAMPYLISSCKACEKYLKKNCPGKDQCEVGLIIKEARP